MLIAYVVVKLYKIMDSSNSWQLAPTYPEDGKEYTWDFATWAWVEQS